MTYNPLDEAIHDYLKGIHEPHITIISDLAENDKMEVAYYFRKEDKLPDIEKYALTLCKGEILDVGACVGAHSLPLYQKGLNVTAIDTAKNAIDYLKSKGIKAYHSEFLNFNKDKFDTILLLMNGIGIAGELDLLDEFLTHCWDLLKPNGRILCDSTDVNYFYEDNDGSMWIDLNANYFGEFKFQLEYKNRKGSWFNWLYLDEVTLKKYAEKNGFQYIKRFEKNDSFLAELIKIT